MPIVKTWEYVTQAYESMFEQMKDAENGLGRAYARHAIGMLKLIPQIRDLPEFRDFELNMSLGKLMCTAKSGAGRVYLACKSPLIYVMETYEKETGYSGVKEYDLKQIVPALQAALKQFSSD